ncbi:hypothetical protein L873DRAFT_1481992 [Choiromyces venosus 120613-1]|uniref:Uncharacterized protein n=1 Tax=Choiromyces venosus 120613-1 TaxID=1336337 RepID=A0A3N4J731_9PEZI|nr:hypothetical protein L873DRAFT_1481992 [Choiromyces venosus 120613-1]
MELRLSNFEKCLHQVKSQILVSRDSRQSLLQDPQMEKMYSTIKEFVDAPNLLSREVDTFKVLKNMSKSISDIKNSVNFNQLKITKDENMYIRVFIKSLFLRLDLKSPQLFDRNKLLAFLMKNGTTGIDSHIFINKKTEALRVLSECLTEEKSMFKSSLKNASYQVLPIESFAQHLFNLKNYSTDTESKKEKMRLVAAKWRFITEEIWKSSLSPRKWWEQVFKCLDTLYKETTNSASSSLDLHKCLLANDISKYTPSENTPTSDDNLNLLSDIDNGISEIEVEQEAEEDVTLPDNSDLETESSDERSSITQLSNDDSIL